MKRGSTKEWTAAQQTMCRELQESLVGALVVGDATPEEIVAVLERLRAWVQAVAEGE